VSGGKRRVVIGASTVLRKLNPCFVHPFVYSPSPSPYSRPSAGLGVGGEGLSFLGISGPRSSPSPLQACFVKSLSPNTIEPTQRQYKLGSGRPPSLCDGGRAPLLDWPGYVDQPISQILPDFDTLRRIGPGGHQRQRSCKKPRFGLFSLRWWL